MPNQKMKSENYSNLGGINNKVSPHLNSILEFLDIQNFDFQTPGCLSTRWGSTTIFTTGTSGQLPSGRISSLYNFVKSSGATKLIASGSAANGASGFIFTGSDYLSAMGGVSLNQIGETFFYRVSNSGITYGMMGIGYITDTTFSLNISNNILNIYDDQLKQAFHVSVVSFSANGATNNDMQWVSYNDFAFGADGNKFIKYNGTSVYCVGLMPVMGVNNYGITSTATSSAATTGFGYSGSWVFYGSFVNNRGFEGEPWPILVCNFNSLSTSSLMLFHFSAHTPLQFGISSINIYSYFAAGTTIIPQLAATLFGLPYRFLKNFPASGSTITTMDIGAAGTTIGGQSLLKSNLGQLPDISSQYRPIGITIGIENQVVSQISVDMIKPSILEIHKDRLFAAGFSSNPRTVMYSDVGEPEGFLPENQFDLSSQDGEPITAMKSYRGQLYVFTRNSVHALSGDNIANFNLIEATREYGCVNKFCVTQFNNVLAFLDRKGLVAFNGANFDRLYDRVQPEFDQMVSNANCRIINDQTRKQIICAIPSNLSGAGASVNSRYPVYDYSANAWTRYSTQNRIDSLVSAPGANGIPEKSIIYGSGNLLLAYGPSLVADGAEGGSLGITLSFKTRFLHDDGDSRQKMFRRLYMNTINLGSTQSFTANFYQDYGTSIVYSVTIYLGGFQDRIDYGISAKSMAFEFLRKSIATPQPIMVSGFTIEHRKLRDV